MKRSCHSTKEDYYVYILECSDGTYYTGYTTHLEQRLSKHNQGLASKCTRSRLPVRLVYYEIYRTKSEAMRREAQIKSMKRQEKQILVQNRAETHVITEQD